MKSLFPVGAVVMFFVAVALTVAYSEGFYHGIIHGRAEVIRSVQEGWATIPPKDSK